MSEVTKKVKVGMIGAGFMGQLAHLQNYVEIKDCEVVALAELRPELRKEMAKRYGIPKTYALHSELLEDREVEAVVAVTARPMTGPIAFDCLRAGKHLITEKPMAHTLAQAAKLVDAAAEQDVVYSVGYMRRHDEGVQKAKELLDTLRQTKELGDIVAVRIHSFQGDSYCNADGHVVTDEQVPVESVENWPIAPDWVPEDLRNDYAWFMNVYCHMFNLSRFLFGKLPAVEYARLDYPKGRVVVLDFGEFLAVFQGGNSKNRDWDEIIDIHFELGCLTIKMPANLMRNRPAEVQLRKEKGEHEIIIPRVNWSWAFRRQAESFVNDVRLKQTPIANAKDALQDMRLLEQIWRFELKRRGQL